MKKYNKGFFRCLKESKAVISKSRDAEAGRVWVSVKNFVCEGRYSAYKKAGLLGELTINGYSDEYISSKLGINESTVRVHRRDLSNELFGLLGDDFFDLLDEFSVNSKEVRKRVQVLQSYNIRAEDLLPLEIISFVRNMEADAPIFNLVDCKPELAFLRKHCIDGLKKSISALDVNKLHYLIGIINKDIGTPTDRYAVLNVLTSQEGTNSESSNM